ncbi:MAG: PIN domain protein [Candidatus Argoarchaeum ethanivorans]|uniref:PIN domain protein n=1 Tax=Candidatus Argoarchaeum ethanivorans TaxID=2608793 RepID=A0A811TEX9_9EURY|nr:MAG: PIN domain protein [Candidatus Argoarchaeum ethanivorans]
MYIDSNIFIFAATGKEELGQNCRKIIKLINEQKITCAASFLVIDEVIWILKKEVGKDDAIKITKAMLSMPIKWIEIKKSVIIKMMDTYEKTTLDPRDAIHISSMKEVGLSVIVSEDDDFDKVEGIERINASECIEKYH